tara:strand:- start:39 stop:248 length:210 start_codon:yes stop_codon:yes gene_type:complete
MFFKSIFKRKEKKTHEKINYKFNMNKWMELTKEERLKIDSKENNERMRKKKVLLKSIRDEYIKIKNKKY